MKWWLLIWCVIGAVVSACNSSTNIIHIDGKPLANAGLEVNIQGLIPNYDAVQLHDPAQQHALAAQAAQQVVDSYLMERALTRAGITITAQEVTHFTKAQVGNLLDSTQHLAMDSQTWNALQRQHYIRYRYAEIFVRPFVQIDDAQIAAYYTKHKEHYMRPAAVKLRHILTKTRQQADVVRSQILAGKNFARLAIEHSVSPEAADGGMLGWVERGQYPEIFETHGFSLAVGAVSGIVSSDYGFHLFKKIEQRKAHTRTLDEVRDEIRARLLADALYATLPFHRENLRLQAKITIDDAALAEFASALLEASS